MKTFNSPSPSENKKVGAPPGSMIHTGLKKTDEVRISLIRYNSETVDTREVESVQELPAPEPSFVTWINIDGLHQVDIFEQLGDRFGIHPLTLEDVLNVNQRPKLEELEDHLFVVLKMLYEKGEEKEVLGEQISFLLGDQYVLSFQESEGDIFDPVRDRIQAGRGRIRGSGPDYLLYSLMDMIVDQYFVILERFASETSALEDDLIDDPDQKTLQRIHALKQDLIFFRKSVWPIREVISRLERGQYELIQEQTILYLRDLYDHTIQVIDTIESLRDTLSGQTDLYLSTVSNRLNEVMKVLTIMGTIFIPLTFIAGVYGMNFKYMPELEWTWGYPAVWGVMIVVALGMVGFFWKKDWI